MTGALADTRRAEHAEVTTGLGVSATHETTRTPSEPTPSEPTPSITAQVHTYPYMVDPVSERLMALVPECADMVEEETVPDSEGQVGQVYYSCCQRCGRIQRCVTSLAGRITLCP